MVMMTRAAGDDTGMSGADAWLAHPPDHGDTLDPALPIPDSRSRTLGFAAMAPTD